MIKIGILSLATALLASSFTFAQDRGNRKARPSPNAAVSQTIGTTIVSLTYGRPGLKGRAIETLVPANQVWRTGANESTTITFSDDVVFGGKAVSAGTYSLYSMPHGENSMTLIINSKLSWGTQYDESQDVVRTDVATQQGDFVEWFTMDFDSLTDTSAQLNLRWGIYIVPVTIETK